MAEPSECNIKVMCRFRPLNDLEVAKGSTVTAKFPSENCCRVDEKTYFFDRIFQSLANQETIYDAVAKPLISNVLSGYNATIFAYGQTSSGKTHTMEGIVGDSKFQGIIPRVVGDIFKQISTADDTVKFSVKVSYFEIYMERIRDLLDSTKRNLDIREDKNRVPYVKDCTERAVTSAQEMMAAFEDGKAIKEIDSTNMNDRSSRSHCVFLIKITQQQTVAEKKLTGKLCLVDLAGSEKVSKTLAEGKQLEEAKRINLSLSVLGKVINALARGDPFIPYRESKLTRLLQESIGGNSRTTVIICCSQASYNLEETKSTLQFGVSAKTIKNIVKVNEELTVDELKRLLEKERDTVRRQDRAVEALRDELERWRNGSFVPRTEWVDFDKLQQDGYISPRKAARRSVQGNVVGEVAGDKSSDEDDNGDNREQRRTIFGHVNAQQATLEMTAAFVAEKAVLLTKLAEAECEKDRLSNCIEEVKDQLSAAVSTLESIEAEDVVSIIGQPLDVLRGARRKLDSIHKENSILQVEADANMGDDDDAGDALQLTSRQEDVTRQMEHLLQQIKEKEELIHQTVANCDNIEKMRCKYEVEMGDLNQKIEELQRERDEIQANLSKQSSISKISEARRLRLQELEKQLADYRRKILDLQKVEKLKEQNQQTIKTLRSDVESMKTARVKLMRQMREDSERYRRGQQKVEQEMIQLRQQGKRRQFEVEKAKQNMDKQLTVYRRKYEEAVAVNKRLQLQMEKQKVVRNDRFTQVQENGTLVKEIRAYLTDELNLEVNAEEARLCLAQLQRQRVDMLSELTNLRRDRKRLANSCKGEPPRKKANFGDEGSGAGDQTERTDEQVNRIDLEIASLEEEISLRATEIDELQKRVDTFDSKARETQRWSNIHTIVHATCALKALFSMAKEAQVNNILSTNRLHDAETKNGELDSQLALLKEALRFEERQVHEVERKYLEQSDRRERERNFQVSYLVKEVMKSASDCMLNEESMNKVMEICNSMGAIENLSEQLDREREEKRRLTQELSKAKVRGSDNRKYFGGVRSTATTSTSAIPKSISDSTILEETAEGLENEAKRVRKPPSRYGEPLNTMTVLESPVSPHYRRPKDRRRSNSENAVSFLGDTTFLVPPTEKDNDDSPPDPTTVEPDGPTTSKVVEMKPWTLDLKGRRSQRFFKPPTADQD